MHRELRRRVLGVEDFHLIAARGFYDPPVAYLPAGFAVEGGYLRNQVDLSAFADFSLSFPLGVECQDSGFRIEAIVADKFDDLV